jgi:cysteine desulfurase / selenocysteine lyase
MPVDVDELGCDALSATGRKFVRGPRGTGLLYVRSSLLERLEPARLDLRAAEWAAPDRYELRRDGRRFEEWEQYDAGKIGLARAIDYVLAWELPAIWERVHSGGERLRELLRGVEGVTIQDPGVVRRGIVTFTVAGIPAEQVKEALAREQITVSVALAGHAVIDASCRMSSARPCITSTATRSSSGPRLWPAPPRGAPRAARERDPRAALIAVSVA